MEGDIAGFVVCLFFRGNRRQHGGSGNIDTQNPDHGSYKPRKAVWFTRTHYTVKTGRGGAAEGKEIYRLIKALKCHRVARQLCTPVIQTFGRQTLKDQ